MANYEVDDKVLEQVSGGAIVAIEFDKLIGA